MFKKILICSTLALISGVACAADDKPSAPTSSYWLQGPSFSWHDSTEGASMHNGKRQWNTTNWGLGIAEMSIKDNFVNKKFVTFSQDSCFNPSLLVGVSRQKTVYSHNGYNLDAGLMGGLWWKTHWSSRTTLPVLMPELSVRTSNYSVDLTYAPKLAMFGKDFTTDNTLAVQFNMKIK